MSVLHILNVLILFLISNKNEENTYKYIINKLWNKMSEYFSEMDDKLK